MHYSYFDLRLLFFYPWPLLAILKILLSVLNLVQYIFPCIFTLFSHLLFFYLWLQYFRRESPLPGRGLGVCPLHRYVRRPAGPRRPHLPGFIIWKFRPSRPGSFLHYGLTLLIWQTSMGICLLVRSWPSIELQVCSDLFQTITQGWIDLYEFDPITFCRASLYNTWSLLVPKASSSVGRSPGIDTAGLYWFP